MSAPLAGLRVAVFGLGEAGSAIAWDLARLGAAVTGFDPAEVREPPGVERHDAPATAAAGASLVMALTAPADAPRALDQALAAFEPGTVYADLASSAPGQKRQLAAQAETAGVDYVDVALMASVPGRGLFTPMLVSGPAAQRYAELLAPAGAPIEPAGADVGLAATRKLIRSVVVKGLAALIVESMAAAHAADVAELNWRTIVEQLTTIDEAMVHRLVTGTESHAGRRLDEMTAAVAMLEELGVEPLLTRGTAQSLGRVLLDGVPALPVDPDSGAGSPDAPPRDAP